MISRNASPILLACIALGCPLRAPAQEPAFLDAMLADVRRLAGQSNAERGEFLQAILAERGVAFGLDEFEIDPRLTYPRTVGTNIVATTGRGLGEILVGGHYDAAWIAGGELSHGAVDNAASAVILTRVAEALSK